MYSPPPLSKIPRLLFACYPGAWRVLKRAARCDTRPRLQIVDDLGNGIGGSAAIAGFNRKEQTSTLTDSSSLEAAFPQPLRDRGRIQPIPGKP